MESGAQGLGPRRIISSSVEVPDMRLAQRTKRTLLGIEVKDVLVLSVNHANCPVPRGLEHAVSLKILAEGEAFTRSLAIPVQPSHKRLAGHPIRLRPAGKFEDRGCERCLIRCKSNPATVLLTRCSDDKRNMDHRPGLIGAVMLIDTTLDRKSVV